MYSNKITSPKTNTEDNITAMRSDLSMASTHAHTTPSVTFCFAHAFPIRISFEKRSYRKLNSIESVKLNKAECPIEKEEKSVKLHFR